MQDEYNRNLIMVCAKLKKNKEWNKLPTIYRIIYINRKIWNE